MLYISFMLYFVFAPHILLCYIFIFNQFNVFSLFPLRLPVWFMVYLEVRCLVSSFWRFFFMFLLLISSLIDLLLPVIMFKICNCKYWKEIKLQTAHYIYLKFPCLSHPKDYTALKFPNNISSFPLLKSERSSLICTYQCLNFWYHFNTCILLNLYI